VGDDAVPDRQEEYCGQDNGSPMRRRSVRRKGDMSNQQVSRSRLPIPSPPHESESFTTVVIAFAANLVIAIAKSVAAMLTGSSAMLAEAAHSWADAGNEIFLVVADRRSKIPADEEHPLGYGREAYVWSMFAAFGLFAAGAAVSVTHGVTELVNRTPAEDFTVGYIVLAVAFVLEGLSFLQSAKQARSEAEIFDRDVLEHVLATSDPTLRAVFAEDSAALVGLVLAALGLGAAQLTGSPVPDAIASILIGLLLAVVALVLINRNRRFLVGEVADPRVRSATLAALIALPDISRVTYLRLEIVGPRQVSLVADVDLTGDDNETRLAERLRRLEAELTETPAVVGAVLSLSAPGEPSLT
jgi:cation diffusion facilitator family transporter